MGTAVSSRLEAPEASPQQQDEDGDDPSQKGDVSLSLVRFKSSSFDIKQLSDVIREATMAADRWTRRTRSYGF
jgi:hypothetical protein